MVSEIIRNLGRRPRWRLNTWWPSDTRQSMQRSLLQLLATAHTLQLDPAPLVANLAQEHRGAYRRRLRLLANRLAEGTALVDALEQTPDVLADEDVLTIRFATQTGTIESAFPQLSDRRDRNVDRARQSWRQTVAYTIVMFAVVIAMATFMMLFIVPVYQQVDAEWGMATPGAFQLFVAAGHLIASYGPIWILAIVLAAFLTWSSPSRRFFRRSLGARLLRGTSQARSAQLLKLLALTVESGRPITSALSTLARYHFDTTIRQRLLFVRNEVEQGADVWVTLAAARLTSPEESNALASSSSNTTRAWTMRRLADWNLDKLQRRRETTIALVGPMIILAFAAFVLVTGLAFVGHLFEITRLLA